MRPTTFAAVAFAALLAAPAAAAEPAIDPFWLEPTSPEARAELQALDAESCPPVADMMEDELTGERWNLKFLRPAKRFTVQDETAHEGEQALAITLRPDDLLWSKSKHKHEIRIANALRCRFGREVWYSFSFRIEGEYPRAGSTRWVVGQWKEENRASPFLAQRFDNGVFHITVQSNDQREVIAAAPGDYDAKFPFYSQSFLDTLTVGPPARTREDYTARVDAFGPDAVDGAALRRAIEEQDLDKFPFIADRQDYRRIDGVRATPSDDPRLPDPSRDWVHMRYRVKGGRDGTGLIEVWANDRFIVRVVGKIGSDVFEGPTQYFKFGHYRDVEAGFGWSTVYFDRFKRGTRRGDVD